MIFGNVVPRGADVGQVWIDDQPIDYLVWKFRPDERDPNTWRELLEPRPKRTVALFLFGAYIALTAPSVDPESLQTHGVLPDATLEAQAQFSCSYTEEGWVGNLSVAASKLHEAEGEKLAAFLFRNLIGAANISQTPLYIEPTIDSPREVTE